MKQLHHLFRRALLAVLLCCGMTSWAQTTVTSSKVTYTLGEDFTCAVTDCETSKSGEFVIPASIAHDGSDYAVTEIGSFAFSICSGLTSVEIPNSVTSIGNGAFYGCSGLTSVEIPNGVTSIGGRAFQDCSGLTSVEIPGSVTSIGYEAFYGCSGLTSVEIPSSVTSIGDDAFSGCSGLTSVTIHEGVTSIGDWAFSYCSGLTSVEIPEGVTSIGGYAFQYCSGLTSIEIPSSVTSIGSGAFSYCSGLTRIDVDANNPNYSSEDGLLLNKEKTTLGAVPGGVITVTIPSSVTSIGEWAFYGCSGLTSIEIPGSVTSIGGYAFSNCSGLTSVEIPNGVTSIGYSAFDGCSGLTSIEIPSSVTSIGDGAFFYCSSTVEFKGATPPSGGDATFSYYLGSRIIVPSGCGEAYRTAYPSVADKIGEKAVVEYFETATAYISDFIAENEPNVGTGLLNVNEAKLNKLKALLTPLPTTMEEADERIAALPDAATLTTDNYRNAYLNYFRFTNTGRGKVLGINAAGKPAGVDASEKDIDQLWQLKPSGSGFKIFHPNTGKYISGMTAGSPAPAATMVDEANARVYTIRVADAAAGTFRFAYSSSTHDCINMEGSGYSSGDYILDSWGGTYSVFTAAAVEEVQVDLRAASIGGAYASAYLPFAVTNVSDGVKAYIAEAIDGDILNMRTEAEIAAHAGFILTADIEITATLRIGATNNAAISVLSGTTTTLTLNDDNRADYLLFGVKKVSAGETASLGFFRPAASIATIAANRAFLPNDGSLNAVRLMFGSNVTDIELLPEDADDDAPVYDLTGRRVVTLRKGMVYVKNGKKFVY